MVDHALKPFLPFDVKGDAGIHAQLTALLALASVEDIDFRPLKQISSDELNLELQLRTGPTLICMNCGYHLDGAGEMPCPDCEQPRTWTSGWNIESDHRFWTSRKDWEKRLFARYRPSTTARAVALEPHTLEQLVAETRMLRSAHDELAVKRYALFQQLKSLTSCLLQAVQLGTLPTTLEEMEVWLQSVATEAGGPAFDAFAHPQQEPDGGSK